jgi:hypothetical protein
MQRFHLSFLLFAGLLLLTGPASAQDVDPVDDLVNRTIDACVGPKLLGDDGIEETLELLAAAPGKGCRKACSVLGKTCLQLVKSEDSCGKGFLKGSGRAAAALCSDSGCKRAVKGLVKTALATYVAQGDPDRNQCEQGVSECQQVCQP